MMKEKRRVHDAAIQKRKVIVFGAVRLETPPQALADSKLEAQVREREEQAAVVHVGRSLVHCRAD